jgi:hypothetical protein
LDVLQVINELNTNEVRSSSVTPAAEGEDATVFAESIRWGSAGAALPTSNAANSGHRPNPPAASDLPKPESRWKFVSTIEHGVVVPAVGSNADDESLDSWQELESYLNLLAQDVWAATRSIRSAARGRI